MPLPLPLLLWLFLLLSILGTWVEHPKQNKIKPNWIDKIRWYFLIIYKINMKKEEFNLMEKHLSFPLSFFSILSFLPLMHLFIYSLNSWKFLLFCFVRFGFGFSSTDLSFRENKQILLLICVYTFILDTFNDWQVVVVVVVDPVYFNK